MDTSQNDARDVLRAAQLVGWYVGMPLYDVKRHRWQMYAFATHKGHRSREWTAIGKTEEECVIEMARRLREVRGASRAAKDAP